MERGGSAAVVHNKKNKVGGSTADLQADAATFQRIHRGSAPRTREFLARAAHHCSAAITSADYKGRLEHRWHDHHATRLVQQVLWDVVRHMEDHLHYLTGILQTIFFGFCIARVSRKRAGPLLEQARNYCERNFRVLHYLRLLAR